MRLDILKARLMDTCNAHLYMIEDSEYSEDWHDGFADGYDEGFIEALKIAKKLIDNVITEAGGVL